MKKKVKILSDLITAQLLNELKMNSVEKLTQSVCIKYW